MLYMKACKFIKKRLQHRCFPVIIVKFSRTPILKNICERLLVKSVISIILDIYPIISYFLKQNIFDKTL